MKVLLIDPKGFGNGPNIGLAYIASFLVSKGHHVEAIDLNNLRKKEKERLDIALKSAPDVIGISISTSFAVKNAINVIKYCKSRNNKAFYVVGGVAVSMQPEMFLNKYGNLFDCGVVGEGEHTFLDLLEKITKGESLSDVKGIVYKEGGKIIRNEDRPFIKNLDSLPFPDYHLFDSFRGKKIKHYYIMTSRGCVYNCAFCLNKILSRRKWRARSPENVIDELKRAKEKYGFESFSIFDDNFLLNPKRAEKICDLMISENLNMKYTLGGGVRADKVNQGLATKLKKSGCTIAWVAIENGDPETFPYVNKGETLEEIERAIYILKNVGIYVKATMIIGLNNTTYKSVLRSMKLLKKLGIRANWYLAMPFEGTELYEWVKNNGRFFLNCSGFEIDLSEADEHLLMSSGQWPLAFETDIFTKKEMLEAYYKANIESGNFGYFMYTKGNYFANILHGLKVVWKYDKRKISDFTMFQVRDIIYHHIKKEAIHETFA